jgi:hypothetical protein
MMISDGETKGSEQNRGGSHAFPLLKNNTLISQTGSAGEPDDCFKPLYSNVPMGGNLSPHKGLGVSCPGDAQDADDSLRRKGFERGFDAGRQDACSLVREEMAPQIKSFADAFSRWNAIMMHAEEKSHPQILKMAVAIAEKILGAAPQCSAGGLESLKADLKARMRETYRLEVRLNPDDMDALSGLMTCENVRWEQWDYIAATGDAEVQRGTLLVKPLAQTQSAVGDILGSLDALLSEVSTK